MLKETALSQTMSRTKNHKQFKKKNQSSKLLNGDWLLDKIIKGYEFLLSRALKGMYIYVHDKKQNI
jgi:DUF2075 family protein